VTHRDFCSSVHIVTGHRRADHSYDIDFDALVRTRGTLIFLMGIAALPDLMNGLLAAGMDPDTPASVLERGTTSKQRRVSATVGTLQRVCSETVIQTPAIIVVGKVCALADTFCWAEKRPLAGVRVLVTRPKELVSTLSNMLREEGAEVLELPAIRTVPVKDMTAVDAAIERLSKGGFDWLVFTSPSGVGIFFDRLIALHDLRALCGVKLAAIGQGTQKALLKYGLRADFLPTVYDGGTLGRELRQACAPGSRILIPRAAIGNPELIEELEKGEDLTVTDVATYETEYVASDVIDERSEIERGDIDFAVFTSASTVRGFAAAVRDVDFSKVNAVCIGKQTAAEAQKRGMRTWVSEKATLEALVKRVEEAARELKDER
jgi:uroporphyrinogen III methyltransferase/synthase